MDSHAGAERLTAKLFWQLTCGPLSSIHTTQQHLCAIADDIRASANASGANSILVGWYRARRTDQIRGTDKRWQFA
jgi:hypothetical protein